VADRDRPTVPEVLPLAQAVYRRSSVGCCLHILLDDYNVQSCDAQYCLDAARRAGHADCLAVAEALMRMTATQRLRLAKRVHRP
jgi:hypothetical protein